MGVSPSLSRRHPIALSRIFAASLWGRPGAALGEPGAQGSLAQLQDTTKGPPRAAGDGVARPKKRRRVCGDREGTVEMSEGGGPPAGASLGVAEAEALTHEEELVLL